MAANLANFGLGHGMIGGIATLRGQIESNREAGLAATEVLSEQSIGGRRARVTGVRAEDPRPISGWIALGVRELMSGYL